jgi:hypothetical protein
MDRPCRVRSCLVHTRGYSQEGVVFLTEEQQVLANNEADKAIEYWEGMQCQK